MTELFIKYLKGHVGDIYVWGAQGETNITEKWIRRRETGEKNAERAIALWEKRKAEGRWCSTAWIQTALATGTDTAGCPY